MKLAPPVEITRPIPPQTTCPKLRALRVKRDEWIVAAAVQGAAPSEIAAALNMKYHQTVTSIISRWRCRHGNVVAADTTSASTPLPSDQASPADKHFVDLRSSNGTGTVTTSISRARAPWEDRHSEAVAERPETAPRTPTIRTGSTRPRQIDINTVIATIRAERDSYLEARHG